MNSLNDITKYRKALIFSKDLVIINNIMLKAIESLKEYKKYVPVKDSMCALIDSQKLVEIHLNHHKNIIKNKGKE